MQATIKELCNRCGGDTYEGYEVREYNRTDLFEYQCEIVCRNCFGDEILQRDESLCVLCDNRLTPDEQGPLCDACAASEPDSYEADEECRL